MSGFTFGIGNDDTKDNLLEDNDFFEEDSIKAGEVPEFNEDTTIINENTSTLEENGLLKKEQGELREIRHKPTGSNVNLENLISKIKKHNKVNQSIALEAYDLGFRDELPRVYTYTTQLSDKHLETTLEVLERGLVTGVSTEDLDGNEFRDLFGKVFNQVNGLVKGKGSDYSFENKKTEKNRYFHISFDSTLEGIWNPKRPDGYLEDNDSDDSSDKTWPYPEPSFPRISVSTSLEGCFRGVYPNVYRYFEVEKYPYMLFNIYEALVDGKEKLLTTSDLTNKRMVWDAHVTEECCFLSPVKMKLVGELKVFNTNKSKTLMIHPFDDKKLPKESAGPIDIKYSIKWTEEEKEDEEEVSTEGLFSGVKWFFKQWAQNYRDLKYSEKLKGQDDKSLYDYNKKGKFLLEWLEKNTLPNGGLKPNLDFTDVTLNVPRGLRNLVFRNGVEITDVRGELKKDINELNAIMDKWGTSFKKTKDTCDSIDKTLSKFYNEKDSDWDYDRFASEVLRYKNKVTNLPIREGIVYSKHVFLDSERVTRLNGKFTHVWPNRSHGNVTKSISLKKEEILDLFNLNKELIKNLEALRGIRPIDHGYPEHYHDTMRDDMDEDVYQVFHAINMPFYADLAIELRKLMGDLNSLIWIIIMHSVRPREGISHESYKENLSPSNESLVMAGVGFFGLFLAGSWAYNKSTEIWNELFGQGPRGSESKGVVEEIRKGLRVVGVKSAPNRRIRLILSDTYDVSKTYVFPFKYIPGLEDGLSPIHNYHEILTRFDAMYKDYIALSHDYRKSIHDYDRYIKNLETDRDYHEERDSEEDLAGFIIEGLERPEFNKDPYALKSHLTYLGNHANIEQKKFKLAWPKEKEVTDFKALREDLRKKYLGNLKKERNIGYDVTGKGDFVKFIEKYNLAKYGDGDELFGTDWIIGCFSLASMNNLLIQLLEDKHVDELFAKVGIR